MSSPMLGWQVLDNDEADPGKDHLALSHNLCRLQCGAHGAVGRQG